MQRRGLYLQFALSRSRRGSSSLISPMSITGAGGKAMLRRSRAIFWKTDFALAIRRLIGQATPPVTSERNFRFCRSLRRFVTSFTGVHEWIRRIQAVILFAISLPFFFLLVREIFGSTAAVWATFFYSFAPLSIFAGRSFMPDVP